MIKSAYLAKVLDPKELRKRLLQAKKLLKKVDYDAIAVRGNSGALFGGALAAAVKKDLLLIRKRGDSTHSYLRVEGNYDTRKFIFVDDFMASGKTRSIVIQAIKAEIGPEPEYVGSLFYSSNGGNESATWQPGTVAELEAAGLLLESDE